jgi:hypothetical protein
VRHARVRSSAPILNEKCNFGSGFRLSAIGLQR